MRLNIIYYHEIVCGQGYSYQKTEICKFEKEMSFIYENSDRYCVVSFDDFLNGRCSERKLNIIISFDDGFKSVLQNAHPILAKYNFKYSIYLATDYVDKQNYLSKEDISFLQQSNLVSFEAHTHSHIDLKISSKKIIEDEIQKSDDFFEKQLGIKPKVFCYPYGHFNKHTERFFIKLKRYDIMLGSFYGTIKSKSNKTLPRIGISNDDSIEKFIDKINGKYNWKGKLQKIRTLLLKKY